MPRDRDTFVGSTEFLIEEAAAETARFVNDTVNTLSANGRGLFEPKITEQEELNAYVKIRGNPELWKLWIREKANLLIIELARYEFERDVIERVHPMMIAQRAAVTHAVRMESLLKKQAERAATSSASVAEPEPEVGNGGTRRAEDQGPGGGGVHSQPILADALERGLSI